MDKQKTSVKRLFWIVISCVVLYVALDIIAQLLPPHYSPISQAESDLAVGAFGYIMTINFLNRGLLSLAFIFAFISTLNMIGVSRSQFRTGIYLLGIWGTGAILLAIFPTDVPATPISWHGAIHLIVALIAFIAGAFGTLEISRKLNLVKELQNLRRVALPLSEVVIVCWVIEFALPFVAPHLNTRIGGLTERLFLGSVLLWIGSVSGYLATHIRLSKEEVANKIKS